MSVFYLALLSRVARIDLLWRFLGALRRHLRRIRRTRNTPRPKLFALNVVFRLFGLNPIYRPLFVHHHHLSRRTPLNFLAAFFFPAGFFTAMNSPEVLLRFVHAVTPPSLFFSCDRFLTAPLRALSPTGLFTAIVNLP
jgi:hypothetical protein